MPNINNYIFIYGTLLDKKNEFGVFLANNSSFFSYAKFKGKMFDAGDYPAVIASAYEQQFVYGSIFFIKNTDEILKVLDRYEGFGDDQEHPNLFIRQLVEVETAGNKMVKCWIYLYNLPVEGLKQIVSGRYT